MGQQPNTNLDQFKRKEPFCSTCESQCDWEDCWHCDGGTEPDGDTCEICMGAEGCWRCFTCLPENG